MQDTSALTRRWVHVLASEIGIRWAGTEGDRRAAAFIEGEFERIFPEVRRHEYGFLGWDPGDEGELVMRGECIPARLGIACPPTAETGITGVLKRMGPSVYGLWEHGADGPSAHLMAYAGPGGQAIPLLWHPYASIPAGIVGADLGERLASAASEEEPVSFACRSRLLPGSRTWNIEGILPGDPHRHVVVIAHYDTVYSSPGANDNGASCACLPALGQELGAAPRGNRPTLHFLATGGEEIDLQGARCYVRDLQWRGEVGEAVLALNFDSLTWGDVVKVGVSDNAESYLATLQESLDAVDLSAYEPICERVGLGEGVDSGIFDRAGIPTVNINTSGDAETTCLWHTPEDTEDRVPWARVDDGVALFVEFLSRIE